MAGVMNHYGQMALEHWQTDNPQELAAIEDPESFFAAMGETIAERVRERTDQILARQPTRQGYVDRLAQQQTARQTAEDMTLREMFTDRAADEKINQPQP